MDLQGHELVLHVLYHLHSLMIVDSVGNASSSAVLYEKFLLGVVCSQLVVWSYLTKIFNVFVLKVGYTTSL